MRLHQRSKGWMKWTLVVMVLLASTALVSSTKPPFTERDKAFYADEALVNFVRPGLVFTVVSPSIASDGTLTVRFKMTDPKGAALEREGINTPGAVSSSFILATIPSGNKFYQSYSSRLKTSTYAPTVGKQARQAAADTGGRYVKVSDGVYDYTFGTKLPASYDKTATHTVAIYGSRNLTEFDLGTNYASTTYSFVPDGTAVKKVRDVISTSSCDKCHDDLSFHGGSRKGVEVCVICHTPAYTLNGVTVDNTNPETGNTIDMTPMVHKIHAGSSLASVQAGGKYQIVGFGNAVSDFSAVNMPSKPNNCQWCHEKGNTATQKDAWLTQPSRTACGSCHDTTNFATGEGHVGLPQATDNQCSTCHIPQGEIDFDASIKGAHVVEQASSLTRGAVAKIVSIENAKPGQQPVLTISLKDLSGADMDIKELIPGAGRGRLAITLAGPTTDYGTGISGTGTNGYVTDNLTVTSMTGGPGTYKYTFSKVIPTGATGTWVFAVEGRTDETILTGTQKQRTYEVNIPNDVKFFSVDGTAVVERRKIVETATCNNCHYNLTLHGENRNEIQNCVICHNPNMTDAARRPAAQAPNESISMASMVHRIHTGKEQPRDYTIYGFGSAAINFNGAAFPEPASARSCNMCHSTNTQNLPAAGILPVTDPRGWLTTAGTASAACLSCHASKDAASHALANTSALGESCATCHGPSADFAVSKVHAQ
ncbi:OmcA/MtrC family decaheme c-type cytochrome [Paludibaculum fermentans]|uniref:OmcA/MtrC family decaheme c-type cytochrome n=1 Tax=Paludibaculum fermentans TaxID=1473598 RepID=UPI003EB87968